jgi:hypothetical protein
VAASSPALKISTIVTTSAFEVHLFAWFRQLIRGPVGDDIVVGFIVGRDFNQFDPDSAYVVQTRRSTGDVKQSNLIRQPDGTIAFIVDFTLSRAGSYANL